MMGSSRPQLAESKFDLNLNMRDNVQSHYSHGTTLSLRLESIIGLDIRLLI